MEKLVANDGGDGKAVQFHSLDFHGYADPETTVRSALPPFRLPAFPPSRPPALPLLPLYPSSVPPDCALHTCLLSKPRPSTRTALSSSFCILIPPE